MSVNPSPIGGFAGQFFDNNGQPLSGGKVYTYAAGTTTPQATYTSALGITPHANPIVLDSAGRVPGGEIWLTDGLIYKFVFETSTAILIGTYDNITGVNSNFVNYTVQEEVITATAGQTVFNLSTINYTPGTNSLSVYIDGVNQYVGDSYLETDSNTVTFTSGVHVGAEVKFTTAVQTTTGAMDASMVGYTAGFTGATGQTVQTKLEQYVSVKDFGAVGDGVTDDTAAIQAALDAGKSVFFPDGFYKCNNLTVSTSGQVLFATGNARLIKNGDGALLTIPVTYVEINGLVFDGTGYTGHNISASGSNLRLINSGSVHAAGRAVLATGSRVQIIGTNYVYQTDDATGTGYDIEIGTAGVATLYHNITGVYSSQATGGILMTSTGTSFVTNSQFGKLTLDAGGAPSGSGAPAIIGNRINGATLISQTGGRYSCNAFNAGITVTAGFEFGYFAPDNSINTSATITGTLPPAYLNPTQQLNAYRPSFAGTISMLRQPTDNVCQFGDNNNNYSIVSSGSNGIYLNISGSSVAQVYSGGFRPQVDGTLNLGTGSQRWNTVYATTGTINTSDGRAKQQSRDLSEAERAVAVRCKALVRAFKLNDAVAAKGDAARWHFGVIAQDVEAAFASEGLNAADYGLFCYDKWEAQPEQRDDEGNILVPRIEAGERYGIRYDELVVFILGAI